MISYIFAMDEERAIGKNNDLPWHLPADFQFFKDTTKHHTIVMGRKTFDSLDKKPLPHRRNIIVTRNKDYLADGCEVVHTIDEAKALFHPDEETFVIGGTELFKLFMDDADRMYITRIEGVFNGDTFFPEVPEEEWKLVSSREGVVDEKNKHKHQYEVYERV
ncbi:dihydrofolate reductase [Alkalicoccobacillus gibsonii]|jgi:dihydrofolate reductase|uniref:dihydrofolate reductase n=1 Tax=Alkalicoccobacillus gibsonii TaxID=79881 RepID=UPI0035170FB2